MNLILDYNIKNMKKYLLILIAFATLLSCDQKEVELYKQDAGIYFRYVKEMQEKEYSFFSEPNIEVKTLEIPVQITGDTLPFDRYFTVKIVEGDNTTASDDYYSLGEGVVKAGRISGSVPITLYKKDDLINTMKSIEIELQPSEDFPNVDLNLCNYKISFTSKIIKPSNWDDYCVYFFGKYSEKWFNFIVEKTGVSDIGGTMSPSYYVYIYYYGFTPERAIRSLPDPDILAQQIIVKKALREYNNTHDEPFTHDDGTIVEMP